MTFDINENGLQNLRISKEGTSNCQTLTLATGKEVTLCAYKRVVAIGQGNLWRGLLDIDTTDSDKGTYNEVVNIGIFASSLDTFLRNIF